MRSSFAIQLIVIHILFKKWPVHMFSDSAFMDKMIDFVYDKAPGISRIYLKKWNSIYEHF